MLAGGDRLDAQLARGAEQECAAAAVGQQVDALDARCARLGPDGPFQVTDGVGRRFSGAREGNQRVAGTGGGPGKAC
jgi:hypothetical protein